MARLMNAVAPRLGGGAPTATLGNGRGKPPELERAIMKIREDRMRTVAISLGIALAAALAAGSAPARANDPITLADVAELSGSGATVGTNWKNGIDLAVEEINAKGGILGDKIVVTHANSQSNAGVAKALCQKALDGKPYALLGPGYSGSVKVCEPLAAEAGIAEIMGGEAADLTEKGNKFVFRTSFGQQIEHAQNRQIHRRQPEGEDGRGRVGQQ